MLMPDVSYLCDDPALGAQAFTIIRSNGGQWVEGRFIDNTVEIKAFGNIQPARDEDLAQVAEGDRKSGAICVYSRTMFQLASQETEYVTSDIIVWNGRRYKLASVSQWFEWGFNVGTFVRE